MADSVIGALRVILGLDTAAFSEGVKKSTSQLEGFAKSVATIASGIQLQKALEGAVKGLYNLTIGALQSADQLGKMAQKFGVPVEELSKLKFAAELSDVSIESLGKGLGKLSKALTEAAAKPTSEAANAFKALGVSVRNSDGSVKSSEQTLLDIADKFSQLKDGAGKTAVSIALFGRAGADLIPLLNQGRKGIQDLKDEAQALGLTITAGTAKSAEDFNDSLKRLSKTWDVIGLRLAAGAAGPLTDVSNAFIEINKNAKLAEGIGEGLADAFKVVFEAAALAAANFFSLVTDIKNFWNFLKSLPGTATEIGDAWTKMTGDFKNSRQEIILLRASFQGLNHETEDFTSGMKQVAAAAAAAAKPTKDLNYAILGGKDALTQFIDSTNKSIAGTKAQAETLGLAAGAGAFLKTTLEGIAIAEANGITITNQRRDALIAAANAAGMAAAQLGAAQAIQEALPEWQKLQDKIIEIQVYMDMFPAKAEQLKIALVNTQQSLQNLTATALATALGNFGQLFTVFGQHNKKLFEIGKAFATAEAIVNTYKAANQALAAPPGPPFSYVYVAAAIAAGLANVIKIQSTKFTAAAMGGSFMVPGGASGVDSKLIPMMLSPGERVDVTPASKVGGSRELVIPAIKPRDFFTGETVREMVMAIDQWQRDGGTGMRFAQ